MRYGYNRLRAVGRSEEPAADCNGGSPHGRSHHPASKRFFRSPRRRDLPRTGGIRHSHRDGRFSHCRNYTGPRGYSHHKKPQALSADTRSEAERSISLSGIPLKQSATNSTNLKNSFAKSVALFFLFRLFGRRLNVRVCCLGQNVMPKYRNTYRFLVALSSSQLSLPIL